VRQFQIQLINYRCFSGTKPISWTFNGEALSSIVGPNNAGKSTFLRVFFELRGFLATLADHNEIAAWATSRDNHGIGINAIDDVAEVPSFGTDGPVIVDFSIDVTEKGQLRRMRFLMNRASAGWSAQLWAAGSTEPLGKKEFPPSIMLGGRSSVTVSPREFCALMRDLATRVAYVPAYRNLINQGGGAHYDVLVGTEFIKLWDNWKNGGSVSNRRTILGVQNDIKELFGFTEFSVDATPGKETFNIIVDGRSERIRELGAGISQFIMVLGNVAVKKPDMLLIDEPELNLHPTLQAKFLTALAKYTNHVVFATHSMGLARTAEQVHSVTRETSGSQIRPLPATRGYAEFLGEMSYSAYRELGFEQVLCVEGVTDVMMMQHFLRLLRLDTKIVVIPLGGESLKKCRS
jgi:hypothetical protein